MTKSKCQHVYTKPAVRKAMSYVDVVGGIDVYLTENRKCQHVYTKPAVRKVKSYVDMVGGVDDVEHLQTADAAQGSEVTQAAVVPGNRGVAQLHTAAAAASHTFTSQSERETQGRKCFI